LPAFYDEGGAAVNRRERAGGASGITDPKVSPLVLIVDDERSNLESLERIFAREGWRTAAALGGAEALELVRRERPAVVVTDLMMPGMSGEELLRAVKTVSPETEVLLVTAHGTVETAVSAMKEGAYDFITKPVKRHAIVKAVRQALERASLVAENRALRARLAELAPSDEDGGLLGAAPAFRAALDTLRQVAPASATVLLQSESGTGKELAARLLHRLSPRAAGPFVPVNCAALPETILESELFGYERGAFTGATQRKEGRFERAHGGTLFLDEVADMSPAVQVKLLRVLQDGVVERLGGTQPVQVDVRIVAASNRDLAAEVRAGRFREDLFYRLDVVTVRLPPLRERREDVPLLAAAFLRRLAEQNRRPVTGFTDAALRALDAYDWPGNVRELQHAVERAVVLCRGDAVDVGDLPDAVRGAVATSVPAPAGGAITVPLGTPLEEIERAVIRETLRQTRGDKNLAARLLGVAARTIYRKLDRDGEGRLVEPGDDEGTARS
jgi:two-component system response regulator HydG